MSQDQKRVPPFLIAAFIVWILCILLRVPWNADMGGFTLIRHQAIFTPPPGNSSISLPAFFGTLAIVGLVFALAVIGWQVPKLRLGVKVLAAGVVVLPVASLFW